MPTNVVYGDQHFAGNLSATTMTIPNSAVTNAAVIAAAGISANKLEQQYLKEFQLDTPATKTRTVHVAIAAGEIIDVNVTCRTAPAAGKSYTVDVQKNGTTVLSAVTTVNDATTVLVAQSPTISVPDYVADDVLSVVVTDVAGGTLGTDLNVQVVLRESPGT